MIPQNDCNKTKIDAMKKIIIYTERRILLQIFYFDSVYHIIAK